MVCTMVDHRNDAIKCSKLKWMSSGFTAKFAVNVCLLGELKETQPSQPCLLQWHLFFAISGKSSSSNCAKRRFSCCFSYFCSTFAASSTNSLTYVQIWFFFVYVGSKIIFAKNQKQNNWHCMTYFVTSVVYLTNRFHVAVRLFSNRSQMTSKCRKNKRI